MKRIKKKLRLDLHTLRRLTPIRPLDERELREVAGGDRNHSNMDTITDCGSFRMSCFCA